MLSGTASEQEANTYKEDGSSSSSSSILTAPSTAFYWSRFAERKLAKQSIICRFPAPASQSKV